MKRRIRIALIVALAAVVAVAALALAACTGQGESGGQSGKLDIPSQGTFFSPIDDAGNGTIIPIENGKFVAIAYHADIADDGTATFTHGNGYAFSGLIFHDTYYGLYDAQGTIEATADGLVVAQTEAGTGGSPYSDITGTYYAALDGALEASGVKVTSQKWQFAFGEPVDKLPADHFGPIVTDLLGIGHITVPALTKEDGTSEHDAETPYYAIDLPSEDYHVKSISGQETVASQQPAQAGYSTLVEGPDGPIAVTVFSNDWGPEGWCSSFDLGVCTVDPNAHVAISVSNNPTGSGDGLTPEEAYKVAEAFAPCVTVH